ncbi:52 kDa repressor of the inhibitor of the protein kinase [Holothuria leucospilota]|uniref:52 kDa repressor of the inhibitor of the protein kinase n=1 Tax=Holothuria leucospilota TaxID=206669 RepID=A0A9Q1CRQ4_HOLLE|nr:52 kDa repressor of the inhibitor of the protein kinase [Holothuria leucospilota]
MIVPFIYHQLTESTVDPNRSEEEVSGDCADKTPPNKKGRLKQTTLSFTGLPRRVKPCETAEPTQSSTETQPERTVASNEKGTSSSNPNTSANQAPSTSFVSSCSGSGIIEKPSQPIGPMDASRPAKPVSSSMSPDYDVGEFLLGKTKATDFEKAYILKTKWKGQAGFEWPFSCRKDGTKRYLRQSHLDKFSDFAYSKTVGGILCKACVLVGLQETHFRTDATLGKLVTKPLNRYDRLIGATGDLTKHVNTEYHKSAASRCHEFHSNYQKNTNVYKSINSHHEEVCKQNRKRLEPLVKTVIFCGQNNIALRGRDDSGPMDVENTKDGEGIFRRLLRYRIESGDRELREQIVSAPRNACYTSGDIQNQIISCVGAEIKEKIINRVKESGFYTIMADETTDVSSTEQLSVCLRYYHKESNTIKEDFISFIEVLEHEHSEKNKEECSVVIEQSAPKTMEEYLESCYKVNEATHTLEEPRLTGNVIGKAIVSEIETSGLSPEAAIAQSYDGASVMSSESIGTCAYVKNHCPYAEYYHCSAHALNLTLVHASKIPAVRNMISTVKEITNFFSTSNKKKITLKMTHDLSQKSQGGALQSLCETRWVERITALENFASNYVTIVRALMAISQWKDVSAKSKAVWLIKSITDSTFIVTLFTCVVVTSNIDQLSKKLQQKNTCLSSAMGNVNNILAVLEDDRKNSIHRFESIMQLINDTISPLKLNIERPRIAKRSTLRSNPDLDTATDYFRVTIFTPFLDTVIEQMHFRFNDKTQFLGTFDILLPSKCCKDDMKEEQFAQLWKKYAATLHANQIQPDDTAGVHAFTQYRQWVMKWKTEVSDRVPSDHMTALQHCDVDMFPCIYALLTIAIILPVSTATVERSFSSLRLLKTYLRNRSCETRLNGLAMMYVHPNEKIDIERVIERFASDGNRRLLLL